MAVSPAEVCSAKKICCFDNACGTPVGKRHNKTHTLCRRCGRRSYHIQKSTCSSCGYPAARIRKCEPPLFSSTLTLYTSVPSIPLSSHTHHDITFLRTPANGIKTSTAGSPIVNGIAPNSGERLKKGLARDRYSLPAQRSAGKCGAMQLLSVPRIREECLHLPGGECGGGRSSEITS